MVQTVRNPDAARRVPADRRESLGPSVQAPWARDPLGLDRSARPGRGAVPAVEKRLRLPPQSEPLVLLLRDRVFLSLSSRLISFEYGSIAEATTSLSIGFVRLVAEDERLYDTNCPQITQITQTRKRRSEERRVGKE